MKVLLLAVPFQHFCLLKVIGMPLLGWRQQMAWCACPSRECRVMCVEWVFLLLTQAGLISKMVMSASYPGWSFSREASFGRTQQINGPEVWLHTGTLFQLNFGLFFFLEETILLQTYHLPQVSEMYIFLSNIKFYSVFCDKYQWDTKSVVVLALVCDMGPRLVRKPAIWYPLKISTPKLS